MKKYGTPQIKPRLINAIHARPLMTEYRSASCLATGGHCWCMIPAKWRGSA
jgi:hypothetical protein